MMRGRAIPRGSLSGDVDAVLNAALRSAAIKPMGNIRNTGSQSNLEADAELREQFSDAQEHLIVALSRLSPHQRTALLKLVASKEHSARMHQEDQLVTAFHQLTPAQQAAVIELVVKIADGIQFFRGREFPDQPISDASY